MVPRTTTINPTLSSRARHGSASSFRELQRSENRPAVRILFALDTIFARIYHHLKVIHPCQIPLRGPAILACNHTSSIDPAFIQSVCRHRLITWMMAREYMDIKGTGLVLPHLEPSRSSVAAEIPPLSGPPFVPLKLEKSWASSPKAASPPPRNYCRSKPASP